MHMNYKITKNADLINKQHYCIACTQIFSNYKHFELHKTMQLLQEI